MIQQVAATEEQYRAVNDAMDTGGNPPAGLILHTGGPVDNGDLRVVDIWESEDAFRRFGEQQLPVLQEVGVAAWCGCAPKG